MQNRPLTIVAVDDNPADFGILRRRLHDIPDLDCNIIHCPTAAAVKEVLANERVDCLFLDYHLGAQTGLDVLSEIRAAGNDVPVITLTGQGNEAVAVEAMKRGAQDYLAKADLTPEALHLAIDNALEKVALTRKLAETQDELKQFASTAAHDLKAPLRRIRQFCQRLQEKCQNKLDKEEYELLDFVVQNADQMHRLVEALLAYTRVGRSETPLKPVALSGVMQVVMANLEPIIEESRALVSVGAMPEVLGDETVLIQLFQNLVHNAIKFRDLTPLVVQVNSQLEGSVWHITVTDNGIGIAPQHHDEIFAPFRRLHAASEYEGSGIGLATCRKIIDQHHGRIWVESNPGQGTTFHLTLPDATTIIETSQGEDRLEMLCAQ
ncbi:MAG: ATP-binding protein [Candidatus Tectomicrobia bacterium]|nr:ATP-binding protein [Candidatus Tectomicrobia bacterium]